MPKRLFPLLLLSLLALLAAIVAFDSANRTPPPTATPSGVACGNSSDDDDPSDDSCADDPARHVPLPQIGPTPAPAGPAPSAQPRVEVVAEGLLMPVGLSWTPDGRKLFFSEVKGGRIRVVVDGVLQADPFVTLPVAKGAETGMLGLAVDPAYATNRYVYAYYSDAKQDRNVVLRFEDRDGRAGGQTEIAKAVSISDAGGAHNGGRLAFGPDGKLYAAVGNGQSRKVGQDPCKLGGKVLRLDPSGQTPPDNPWTCAPTWALGFRNPFGIAFHPVTGAMFVTDNGGRGHDELDLVRREGNYGHPVVEGIPGDPRFVDPLWESGPISIGPSGMAFYTGDRLPEYRNDLFFCGVHNGQLTQVRLAGPGFDRVEAVNVGILRDQVDCRLDVSNGPDGALYFADMSRIMRITR